MIAYDENQQIKKKIVDVSTRKRKKIDKEKKSEIRRKIDDDAILYSFQKNFIRKIFYLILKKFDDHLKKQRNKKEK